MVIYMNKKYWIIFILFATFLIGFFVYFFYLNRENNNQADYSADRSSTSTEISTEENFNKAKNIEEQIATFSTKIYSTDSARQNNINITCNTLNETIVKNEETFSFCDTVGQSTTSKGYQKADIFDKNGNKKKGLRRAVIVK